MTEQLKQLIADDSFAITFQSLGQYRKVLLAALDAAPSFDAREAALVYQIEQLEAEIRALKADAAPSEQARNQAIDAAINVLECNADRTLDEIVSAIRALKDEQPTTAAVRLTPAQIFDIASKYFKWNAPSWRDATEGATNMPLLLSFVDNLFAATSAVHQDEQSKTAEPADSAQASERDAFEAFEAIINAIESNDAITAAGLRKVYAKELGVARAALAAQNAPAQLNDHAIANVLVTSFIADSCNPKLTDDRIMDVCRLHGWQQDDEPSLREIAHAFYAQGWAAHAPAQPAVPEGYAIVPIDASTEIIVAIENAIDSQLIASGMRPADMYRQDGQRVWDAAIAALSAAPQGEQQP